MMVPCTIITHGEYDGAAAPDNEKCVHSSELTFCKSAQDAGRG